MISRPITLFTTGTAELANLRCTFEICIPATDQPATTTTMSVRKASDDLLVRNSSTNVPAVPTDGTKRKLTEHAQWKIIQKNTFTRWTNERLKTVTKHVTDLETDLSDGLRLIALVEVLSGKRLPKFNNSPTFKTMKLENVTMALKFLQVDEGIKIVNIDSSDIVDHNLKLILGLIWTLILHYSNSMPLWEDDEGRPQKQEQTPKQRLFGWIQGKLPDRPVGNLTTDWNDGKAIGALVDGVAPEVEQLEKQLDATKMNLKEANRRIEHLEDLQKTMDSTKTELKESKREKEILKEDNKILNQEMERNSKLALEVEQLKKELNETNLKLQEAKRRTEDLDDLQKTIETELIDAKREIENLKEEKIMKQELESNTKLECRVRYEGTTEVAVNKDFVPDAPARTFDDSSMLRARDRTFIVGMKLHIRLWGTDEVIGAMEVFYNTGQSVVHGSKNPKTAVIDEEFFVGEGEFITEIDVQSGWMLDRLTFTTNKGIVYGPYGGEGGGRRRFVCPCEGAYLAYITGSVDDTWGATAVRRLRFFWGVPK